jgi:hypothetical protein
MDEIAGLHFALRCGSGPDATRKAGNGGFRESVAAAVTLPNEGPPCPTGGGPVCLSLLREFSYCASVNCARYAQRGAMSGWGHNRHRIMSLPTRQSSKELWCRSVAHQRCMRHSTVVSTCLVDNLARNTGGARERSSLLDHSMRSKIKFAGRRPQIAQKALP